MTSVEDAIQNFLYLDLIGEPLRVELNSTFSPENVTELIVMDKRISWAAVDTAGVVEKDL